MLIRASIGTAAVIGLEKVFLQAKPTTGYLMQYSEEHCSANCAFCPQAQASDSSTDRLSRILWPAYKLQEVIAGLQQQKSGIKRLCIQTVNFPNAEANLLALLRELGKANLQLPLSVCCFPVSKEYFQTMKELGVSRVGVAFDCATPTIFTEVKGEARGVKSNWASMEQTLADACAVFGARFVSTHLIVGLGETEEEAIRFLQTFSDKKITVGLFAFTPIRGTALEKRPQPELVSYRKIQLARQLIVSGLVTADQMSFSRESKTYGKLLTFGLPKEELVSIVQQGTAFQTSGCPHCNRPFYNEKPGSTLYNFPWEPNTEDLQEIKRLLADYL